MVKKTKIFERVGELMIGYCNFIPDAIWVRETENGTRRITLRRNFTEETIIHQEADETQFRFDETDVFIPDRDNIQDFIANNFGNLFDLGIMQIDEKQTNDTKIQTAQQIVQTGTIVDDLQAMGQKITDLMLGV